MSLLEELLNAPSNAQRYGQLQAMQQQAAPAPDPRAGGQGLSSFDEGTGGSQQLAQRIANWIENVPGTDFQVSGLEGFQGTGQISSGHIENSQHYTGNAGDVSYLGGKRFEGENPALDWLYNRLNHRWGDQLTELLWQVPDHYDHLHYGDRPGG